VTEIPRGKYIGRRTGDPPQDEAEHLIRCPACGGWIDCRDLGQVFEHEGPLPPPRRINRNKDGALLFNSPRDTRNMGVMMVMETDHETA
jgi:hypothetical protein